MNNDKNYKAPALLLEALEPHRSLEHFELLRAEVEALLYGHPDGSLGHLVRKLPVSFGSQAWLR